MEIELRGLEARSKSKCTQQVAQFKADLATFRRDLERMRTEDNRDYLFDVRDPSGVRSIFVYAVPHPPLVDSIG